MSAAYDRASAIKAFDETKAGVKGLVDAGVTTIPPFFHQPREASTSAPLANSQTQTPPAIPVVDLAGADAGSSRRAAVVEEIRLAAGSLGFFQVVNHGIPLEVLNEMLEGVRRFNEQPNEVKRHFYSRDSGRKVSFYSNFDLYSAPAANWRDSMFSWMAPEPPQPEELPLACREITFKYSSGIHKLGILLLELLSEALGLRSNYLEEMECAKGHALVSNYYPPCPEPHLTLGTSKHSDPDFFTILLQDQIGGLQVLDQQQWVDVPPLKGALVVNIGDLLQLISNDKLKSVEHRVLASKTETRVSVACFFTLHLYPSLRLYGPIKELLSDENPPLYKDILLKDFISFYDSKGLDGRSALSYFRL